MNELNEFLELEKILDSEELGDECLTFIEAHGYIAATVISPVATSDEQLFNEIIGVDTQSNDAIKTEIKKLRQFIARELLAGEPLSIPLSSENEEEYVSEMEAWSAAFMEKHLLDEAEWFEEGGEVIAELLLPIVVASGLFDDEEINKIRDNDELYISMLENSPEVVIDLYVIFHETVKA